MLVLAFSCEKEPEYCWDCLVTTKVVSPGITTENTSPVTECGMTEDEAGAYMMQKVDGNTTTWAVCTKVTN